VVYLAVVPWFQAMISEQPPDVILALERIDAAIVAVVPHCHYCADLSLVRGAGI
jgi:hypothetical protein